MSEHIVETEVTYLSGFMAQNGFCFKDIYLLTGINKFFHTRAPMWLLHKTC